MPVVNKTEELGYTEQPHSTQTSPASTNKYSALLEPPLSGSTSPADPASYKSRMFNMPKRHTVHSPGVSISSNTVLYWHSECRLTTVFRNILDSRKQEYCDLYY